MKKALFFLLVFVVACPNAPRTVALECGDGMVVLLGACVSYRVADAFCGKTAKPANGGCARIACAPGESLDVEHGMCLPESTVFLGVNHAPAGYDETPRRATCAFGSLTSRGPTYSCAMGKLACGRGEHWMKAPPDAGSMDFAGKCAAQPPCALGEIFDESSNKCAKVVRNKLVDVGTWARLAIGTDTAEGTNAFCAPIRAAGIGAKTRYQIELTLPDNDVTRASARLVPRGPVPANVVDAAHHSLDALVEMLHFYGGSALAAAVTLEVECTPAPTTTPTLEVTKP